MTARRSRDPSQVSRAPRAAYAHGPGPRRKSRSQGPLTRAAILQHDLYSALRFSAWRAPPRRSGRSGAKSPGGFYAAAPPDLAVVDSGREGSRRSARQRHAPVICTRTPPPTDGAVGSGGRFRPNPQPVGDLSWSARRRKGRRRHGAARAGTIV